MSESEVIRSCSTFQHPLIHTFTYIHIHADKVPTLCLNRAGPSPLQCSAPGPLLCEQSWWAALSHQVSHTQEFVFLHESRSGLFSLYLACKLPWSCSAVEMCSAIDHTRCVFPSFSIITAKGVFESKYLTTGVYTCFLRAYMQNFSACVFTAHLTSG